METMLKKVGKEGSGVCSWLFLENSLPTRGRTPWAVKVCGRTEFIIGTSQFPRNKEIQDDNPRKGDGELLLR
jgi:hypothetical protein